MAKTAASTHADRRRATPIEITLLDELDRLITKRDHEEGILGNLRGKLKEATEAVDQKATEVANFEIRAARTRKAFEVLHVRTLDETAIDSPEDDVLVMRNGDQISVHDEAFGLAIQSAIDDVPRFDSIDEQQARINDQLDRAGFGRSEVTTAT